MSYNTNKRVTISRNKVFFISISYIYVYIYIIKTYRYMQKKKNVGAHGFQFCLRIFNPQIILWQFQLKVLPLPQEYSINPSTIFSKRSCHPTLHNKSIQASSFRTMVFSILNYILVKISIIVTFSCKSLCTHLSFATQQVESNYWIWF